jgi:hypothetical protein
MNNNTNKECRLCKLKLSLENFSNHQKTKDKKQSYCIDCMRIKALAHYNKNKDKSNARRRDYYKEHKK